MARTRGAGAKTFHQDDGELIGKDGEPLPTGINPTLQHDATPKLIHMDDGELVPPPVKAVVPLPASLSAASEYLCDRTTWQRTMEAIEVLQLLELFTGPLSVTLAPEDWSKLSPNVRRHFRRIV